MSNLSTERYEFKKGEVVTIGGNRNVFAEVLGIEDGQLKVKVLTPPERGQIRYTTTYTYYSKPVPGVTVEDVELRLKETLARLKEQTKTSQNNGFVMPQIELSQIQEESTAAIETTSNSIETIVEDLPVEPTAVEEGKSTIIANDTKEEVIEPPKTVTTISEPVNELASAEMEVPLQENTVTKSVDNEVVQQQSEIKSGVEITIPIELHAMKPVKKNKKHNKVKEDKSFAQLTIFDF